MPAANEHHPSFASASMPAEAQQWAEIASSSAPKEDGVLAMADDDSQLTCRLLSLTVCSVVMKSEVVQDAEVSSSTLMYDDVLGGVAANESAADALCLCG